MGGWCVTRSPSFTVSQRGGLEADPATAAVGRAGAGQLDSATGAAMWVGIPHACPSYKCQWAFLLCVCMCVCLCASSPPHCDLNWPPPHTHSLQHYTKHSSSLLSSITTSIALNALVYFVLVCFLWLFIVILWKTVKRIKGKECLENTPCSSFLLAVGNKTNVYLFLSSALPSSLALHNSWVGDEEAFSLRHYGVHIMRLNCLFGAWNDLLTLSERLITEFNSSSIPAVTTPPIPSH